MLRTLRRTSEVYVIMVTACAEELDKLVGLQVGADDQVTKPFSPREVAGTGEDGPAPGSLERHGRSRSEH